MPFIDKVKKNDVEYDIHDTTGRVSIDGASLVIPEQESALEPVAEFDGVKYYHKQEFDLLSIFENAKEGYTYFDLVTGETFVGGDCSYLSILNNSGAPGRQAGLVLNTSKRFIVYATSPYATVNYTSRALTVVDTSEEVTDNTKICLPTCSDYYGFLSEDGNTFTSYYNLKGEGISKYVDSVKQGDSVLTIRDVRVPETKPSDENKIVYVDVEGNFALREETVISASTLYMHKLQFEGLSFNVIVITDNSDAITYSTKYGSNHLKLNTTVIVNVYALVSMNGEEPKIITYAPYYGADGFGIKYLAYTTPSSTTITQIDISTLTSDIVTII